MQEAGQGKTNEAEAAWVEREAEMARVKATTASAELTLEIDGSQRNLIHNPPEGRKRIGAEEDRRRVEKEYDVFGE